MSKADEMFGKLGYEKIIKNKNIKYEYKRNPFKTFEFLMDKQEIELNNVNLLTKKRLQAINEKVKELGWNE